MGYEKDLKIVGMESDKTYMGKDFGGGNTFVLTHERKIGTEKEKRSEKWHRGKGDAKTNK